ncbi:MAG: nuclear transport factor 2 family protein [Alphaproteobacteria bacterium]
MKPEAFILDVDGVMTDGTFLYGREGKFAKRFSADDHDALSLLKNHLEVLFVTGDHRGFDITKSRIGEDMRMPLHLVSTVDRLSWIAERHDLAQVIYMGDGIFDGYVFQGVGYSIAVADALPPTKAFANFVTDRRGGDRAVAEAVLHILSRFFEPFDLRQPLPGGVGFSGHWKTGGGTVATPVLDPLAIVRKYMDDFSNRRIDVLIDTFADDMVLIDWTLEARGKTDVVAAYRRILNDLPPFTLDIKTLRPIPGGAVAELVLGLGSLSIDIVDIVELNPQGKITAVTAYKGTERTVAA